MPDADPKIAVRIALISAATSIATALLTAGVTVYATSKQASKSADDAAAQAKQALASATEAQSRAEAFVPAGSILAIKGDCPKGWRPFAEGNGRFVVGASTDYPSGSIGGSAEQSQTFVGVFETANDSGEIRGPRTHALSVPSALLLHTRASLPKELPLKRVAVQAVPPYIALTQCLKP